MLILILASLWLTPPTHRVVSLAPTLTEVVFALGAGDSVVGVTRYDHYPAAVEHITHVGGLLDPDVEVIAGLEPNLILATDLSMTTLKSLEHIGLHVVRIQMLSLDDLFSSITTLGHILQHDSAADALLMQLQHIMQTYQIQALQHKATNVLMIVGRQPLVAAGPQSYLGNLLTVLSMHNVVQRGPAFAVIDEEALMHMHPDYIIDVASDTHNADVWKNILQHLPQTHLIMLQDDTLMHPSIRLDTSLKRLTEAIWQH